LINSFSSQIVAQSYQANKPVHMCCIIFVVFVLCCIEP